MNNNDDLRKWQKLVEAYSTLHSKDTVQLEGPDPDADPNAEPADPVDKVCVDAPLLIRLMEFAREDAKDDEQLHKVAERCIALNKQVEGLTMEHYDQLTAALEPADPQYTEAPAEQDTSSENR